MSKENILFCPLQEAVKDLERKWSFQIMYEIGNHKEIRFGNLQKELRYISPKTLSDTLLILEQGQLVKKLLVSNYQKKKIMYKLTYDGINLYPIVIDLLRWSISRKKSGIKHCLCTSKPETVP